MAQEWQRDDYVKDAYELYRKFDFTELNFPDRFMEKRTILRIEVKIEF